MVLGLRVFVMRNMASSLRYKRNRISISGNIWQLRPRSRLAIFNWSAEIGPNRCEKIVLMVSQKRKINISNCHNTMKFTDSTSNIVPVRVSSNSFERVQQNTQLSEPRPEPHVQF